MRSKDLAKKYNLSRSTVRKWQSRKDSSDRSHRPRRLQTTLYPAQESVVVAMRQVLLLPLVIRKPTAGNRVCQWTHQRYPRDHPFRFLPGLRGNPGPLCPNLQSFHSTASTRTDHAHSSSKILAQRSPRTFFKAGL
jgi:hypothetical protein